MNKNLDLKVIFEMQVKSYYLNIRIKSYDNNYKRVSSRSAELKLVQIQNPIYVLEIQNRLNQKPNVLNLCVCIWASFYPLFFDKTIKNKSNEVSWAKLKSWAMQCFARTFSSMNISFCAICLICSMNLENLPRAKQWP